MGDHIKAIKVVTADGRDRWIERGSEDASDRELFYAILGGSPGNFAILTHIRLQALRSSEHPHVHGLRLVVPYTMVAVRKLLQVGPAARRDSAAPSPAGGSGRAAAA